MPEEQEPDVAEADEVIDPEWDFGRIEDPEDLPDFTPKPFSIYGYEIENGEEHRFIFHARATQPFGATMEILRYVRPDGSIPTGPCIDFIQECIVDDETDRWKELVHNGKLHFETDAILTIAQRFIDFYGGANGTRPTSPRRARRAGTKQTSGTSTVEHSGRTSTSRRSRATTR